MLSQFSSYSRHYWPWIVPNPLKLKDTCFILSIIQFSGQRIEWGILGSNNLLSLRTIQLLNQEPNGMQSQANLRSSCIYILRGLGFPSAKVAHNHSPSVEFRGRLWLYLWSMLNVARTSKRLEMEMINSSVSAVWGWSWLGVMLNYIQGKRWGAILRNVF